MGKSINAYAVREADLVVRPSLAGVGSADFRSRRQAIEAGRVAMQQLMPQLRVKQAELARLP